MQKKAAVPSVDIGGSVDQKTGLIWKQVSVRSKAEVMYNVTSLGIKTVSSVCGGEL